MISAPAPKMLMQASVKQALRRLDNVDPGVKEFFKGAAKTVAEGADPVDALAAALGCMSGFTEVPQDRSLLTQVRPGLSVSKPSPRLPFEAVSPPSLLAPSPSPPLQLFLSQTLPLRSGLPLHLPLMHVSATSSI